MEAHGQEARGVGAGQAAFLTHSLPADGVSKSLEAPHVLRRRDADAGMV
jgi:hypothetical protein